MQLSKTVILNCAGLGSRLGLGKTKALLHLGNKPLIHWQLDLLKEIEDIRIVIGFEAQAIINAVLPIRNDVLFVFNHDYRSTKTGFSLALAAAHTDNFIISLDGDLLIHPDDFKFFLSFDEECLAYTETNTEQPCYIELENKDNKKYITQFTTKNRGYEWTGLAQLHFSKIKHSNSHVYKLLNPHLPLLGVKIRSQEIDTIADYNKALYWINAVYPKIKEGSYVEQRENRKLLEKSL